MLSLSSSRQCCIPGLDLEFLFTDFTCWPLSGCFLVLVVVSAQNLSCGKKICFERMTCVHSPSSHFTEPFSQSELIFPSHVKRFLLISNGFFTHLCGLGVSTFHPFPQLFPSTRPALTDSILPRVLLYGNSLNSECKLAARGSCKWQLYPDPSLEGSGGSY